MNKELCAFANYGIHKLNIIMLFFTHPYGLKYVSCQPFQLHMNVLYIFNDNKNQWKWWKSWCYDFINFLKITKILTKVILHGHHSFLFGKMIIYTKFTTLHFWPIKKYTRNNKFEKSKFCWNWCTLACKQIYGHSLIPKKKGWKLWCGTRTNSKVVRVQSKINLHKPRKRIVNIIWSQNVVWTNHEQVKFIKHTWLGLGKKPPQLFYNIIDN